MPIGTNDWNIKTCKNIYISFYTVFWLASLHLWGNARNCGRQLSAQDLLLWVSRTLVQFRTKQNQVKFYRKYYKLDFWIFILLHTFDPTLKWSKLFVQKSSRGAGMSKKLLGKQRTPWIRGRSQTTFTRQGR